MNRRDFLKQAGLASITPSIVIARSEPVLASPEKSPVPATKKTKDIVPAGYSYWCPECGTKLATVVADIYTQSDRNYWNSDRIRFCDGFLPEWPWICPGCSHSVSPWIQWPLNWHPYKPWPEAMIWEPDSYRTQMGQHYAGGKNRLPATDY